DRGSKYRRAGTQATLPESVAQDDYLAGAGLIVIGTEAAPEHRIHPQNIEEICGHIASSGGLRDVVGGQIEIAATVGGESVEDLGVSRKLRRVGGSKHARVNSSVYAAIFPHTHELIEVAKIVRMKQQRVDHAEDGSVGANPQGQRENRHDCKTRTFAELTQSEAKILAQVLDQAHAASMTAIFLDLFDTTKGKASAAEGLFPRVTGPYELLDFAIEVEAELFMQLVFRSAASEKSAQPESEVIEHKAAPKTASRSGSSSEAYRRSTEASMRIAPLSLRQETTTGPVEVQGGAAGPTRSSACSGVLAAVPGR